LLLFIVAQYVAHGPEATLPHDDVNVPGDYLSLTGFEVTTYGRFWVIPEDQCPTGESSKQMVKLSIANSQ
jgi:hypothetical protein